MSIANTSNLIRWPSCTSSELCPGVNAKTLKDVVNEFPIAENEVQFLVDKVLYNNETLGKFNQAPQSYFFTYDLKETIQKTFICNLRSTLFSGDTFSNANESDRCNQEKIKSLKIFFEKYFDFLNYIAMLKKTNPNPDKINFSHVFMDLFFLKDLNATKEVKCLDLEMQVISEKNDKEKLQSYLEGNQTQYKRELQDLKAANQKMNRFIFLSSFIGFLSTLVASFIGCMCYRKNQSKKCVDTSDNLEELSLDEESLMADNVSKRSESEKSS